MSPTKMTTLPFVLLVLSPFVIFDSDYALIWFLLCNSNTLSNILMVLGRNIEQDETFCLSYFWHYLPLLYLTVIMLCALEIKYPSERFDDTW